MRVGVFHPGTQHSWQTALAFQERGDLSWYATSVFYDPKRWPYRIERYVPARHRFRLHRDFTRRYTALLDPQLIRHLGWWEWLETAASRLNAGKLASRLNKIGNTQFGAQVVRLIEREPVDLVWGFNTSALEVFRWAKPRGIRCILDQTIGHPFAENTIMSMERKRHPEFFLGAHQAFPQSWIERQNEEFSLADRVVVGSEFCARTMIENGCSAEKVLIVPYGFDETVMPDRLPSRPDPRSHPMKFVFVGTVSARKGVQYLLPAFARLPKGIASLTLVGKLDIPAQTFARFADRVHHVPQVPRSEVVRYFLESDCFVFPSLFEGSALVLYEAVGSGLGIIQSDSAGTGVISGQNGIMLQAISSDGVLNAMEAALDHPDQLRSWQEASWNMRAERTWGRYREKVRQLVAQQFQ